MICERCGQDLNPALAIWLELNALTGKYSDPNVKPVPEGRSQGCFPFGSCCAKTAMKEGHRDGN